MGNALSQSTSTTSTIEDYSVSPYVVEDAAAEEYYYTNPNYPQNLGYYKTIPELKQAIDALAVWAVGRGWTSDIRSKVLLDHITGWGEDTFQSILMNLLITKKINGDAFCEIIRDKNKNLLLNLKPLNPSKVRIVVNKKGFIKRYDVQDASGEWQKFEKDKILHLCNDRIASEIHGTSIVESVKWIIDARNELMTDMRRISHRSTIRVLYVDYNDKTKLSTLRDQYEDAMKKGEVLILPGMKGKDVEIVDYGTPPIAIMLQQIQYYENFFYQAVGVPKVVLGGAQEYSEAGAKVGYMTWEQPYMTEQRQLEYDLWNQLGVKVEFEKPISMKDAMQQSEAANTGQVGIQQNETTAGVGRTE